MKVPTLALLLTALSLCGCKGGSTASQSPVTLPAGWTRVTSSDGELTIGVAPGWKKLDKGSPFSDVGISGGLDSQKLTVVHDPSASSGVFHPMLSVNVAPGANKIDHKDIIDGYISGIKSAGYLNISSPKTEDLPLGSVSVVTYEEDPTQSNGVVKLNATEYYAFDGDLAIHVKTEIPQGSGLDAEAAAMVKMLTAK